MVQKVAVSREFEARLRHAATGKLSLSTQQKMGTFFELGRIRQRKENRGGGSGGRGVRPPNNLREGGGNITFGPPNNPPTFSFNFYVKQEK